MSDWRDRLPAVRGRTIRDAPLAPYTWLRVGGPADLLFLPEDEADLAALRRRIARGWRPPVSGSNRWRWTRSKPAAVRCVAVSARFTDRGLRAN